MIVALLLVLASASIHLFYLAWLSRAPRAPRRTAAAGASVVSPPSAGADGAAAPVPRVDVLIPTRNEARFVAEKLRNLQRLTYPADRLTFWVLDGNSDDGTRDEAARVRDDRIRIVSTGIRGKAAQLNVGLRRTTADLILVTDADARLQPDTLTRMVAVLHAAADVAVVGVPVSPGPAHPAEQLHWRLLNWICRQEARYGSVSLATGPCYLYRRTLIDRLPADAEGDDVFVSCAAAAAGSRVGWAETMVTELRTPRSAGAMFRFRRRRMAAYLKEVVRFLPRAASMAPPARRIFLWRAVLLMTIPLATAAGLAALLMAMLGWAAAGPGWRLGVAAAAVVVGGGLVAALRPAFASVVRSSGGQFALLVLIAAAASLAAIVPRLIRLPLVARSLSLRARPDTQEEELVR